MTYVNENIAKLYLKAAVAGHKAYFVVLVEVLLIASAALTSFYLRLEVLPTARNFIPATVLLIAVRLVFLYRYNMLRGWWRYTGFNEAVALAKATAFGTIAFYFLHSMAVSFAGQAYAWPRSLYLIEGGLTALMLGAARAGCRALANHSGMAERSIAKKLVLIGAGEAALRVIQELEIPGAGFRVMACVDDDPSKQGVPIRGVKVEGSLDSVSDVATRFGADEIWIAVPTASASQMNRMVRLCADSKLPYKSLPRPQDLVNGAVVAQVREVSTTDLLGREQIVANLRSVRDHIKGRRVMVTGAAGSIGSELCSQLLGYDPAELICLDQSETGMFYLELKQRPLAVKVPVSYCVADIANVARMQRIITEHRVEIIFHTAAYKHVPVMESNVPEAVYNNITAVEQLLDTADKCNVKSFVMISSDKAVNPTNVMGASKRVGELIVASRPRSRMSCVAVRFGNVLGSNGSVVPIFQEQIRLNNEITITHPEIKRYFMTIDEAVSLVLQAFTVGDHGDILVLDMGEPVRIVDLAKNLIRLSGKTEKEVRIRYVGLRDGEKLKEELFYESEQVRPTECNKVLRTRSTIRRWSELSQMLKELDLLVDTGSNEELKMALKAIVPEYDAQELTSKRFPCSNESATIQRGSAANASTSIQ
jgi:FlaA1/EpsC-like NDP-sugar epimerase